MSEIESEHRRRHLNLGCLDRIDINRWNVDRVPGPDVDEVVDLSVAPWPWPDGSVDSIAALHVVEHLPDKIRTMNECWRVLRSEGLLAIQVPTTDGPGAFQDPTHVSFWNRRSFLYYETGSSCRERLGDAYGIVARFRVLTESTALTEDGPILSIVLVAVKP